MQYFVQALLGWYEEIYIWKLHIEEQQNKTF